MSCRAQPGGAVPPTCCDLEQVAVRAGTLSWAPGQARALQRSGRVTRVTLASWPGEEDN